MGTYLLQDSIPSASRLYHPPSSSLGHRPGHGPENYNNKISTARQLPFVPENKLLQHVPFRNAKDKVPRCAFRREAGDTEEARLAVVDRTEVRGNGIADNVFARAGVDHFRIGG